MRQEARDTWQDSNCSACIEKQPMQDMMNIIVRGSVKMHDFCLVVVRQVKANNHRDGEGI